MRRAGFVVVVLLVAAGLVTAQTPPVNLQGELMVGGEVQLTWDPPPEGLNEDFEDGVADDFGFYPGENNWTVDGGYLKSLTANTWQCAWYTGMEFTEFTVESEFMNQESNSSRGIQFRADGPRDSDYNGYNFYVAYNVVNYSVYRFINGSGTAIVGWTQSDLINTEPGETNTLKVVGSGGNFDLYINGTLVESFTDNTHDSGMVGCIGASSVVAWYDYITCLPSAEGAPLAEPEHGAPSGACDESGRPLAGRAALTMDGAASAPAVHATATATRELDDFIEYRIYRDGEQIGTSQTEEYTDQLPGLGSYEYTVTAFYDEGESDPAGPVTVT